MDEICCDRNLACQEAYIVQTSQPLQHHLRQPCRSSYNGNDSAVFRHIIARGHEVDGNDVATMDREENWFERGVKNLYRSDKKSFLILHRRYNNCP